MSYVPPQIRRIIYQTFTFSSGGATTQACTLSTSLTDYTKALINNKSRASMVLNLTNGNETSYYGEITSNSNVNITGATGAGDKSIAFMIVEYQNLPA